MKQTITCRLTPCACGCEGSDPWHKQTYTRHVRDIVPQEGQCFVHAHGYNRPVAFRAVGTARLPFGAGASVPVVEMVVKHGGRETRLGWYSVAAWK